ncbi:MAG TPA: DNA-formamidopyrimidine glycosylase family protein [Spirochaetota bacterium]|nr:DNA-formamidopyrimidine glycosylase family protein [Spirochaetota bacterium]
MPELPDLEIYKENLKKKLLGLSLKKIKVDNPKQTNFKEEDFNCAGKILKDIFRNGKEIFFLFKDDAAAAEDFLLSVHLMLSGKLDIVNDEKKLSEVNSLICSLFFENMALFISDYQNMCKITLNPKITNIPDALSEDFTLSYLSENLKKRKIMNIKSFLTDQKILKGIGNAYADEILYRAQISPHSYCGKIPQSRIKILYESVKNTLEDAIKKIKTIAPDIISGEVRSFLEVHNKEKRITNKGEKILIKTVASKKTYYTEEQIFYF